MKKGNKRNTRVHITFTSNTEQIGKCYSSLLERMACHEIMLYIATDFSSFLSFIMDQNQSPKAHPADSYSSLESQRKLRIEKLDTLKAQGIDPYPVKSKRDGTLAEIRNYFEDANSTFIGDTSKVITLIGRVKSKRLSGKIAFAQLEDATLPTGFQAVFKLDMLPSEPGKIGFAEFKTLIDEGDFLQLTGYLDRSQTGEPSIFVSSIVMISKALRPLPDRMEYEHVESRYTNRVADFKMNTKDESGRSVRDVVQMKAKYWQIWREEMAKEGFLEVECPVFEAVPGGAEAKPFTTFYNELDQEMYLRISLELPLKKLIAGGFEAVYEIGRIFRNEGSSPQHLQEYTQIEWYIAYRDYEWAMAFAKRVYQRIVKELLGTMTQVDYHGRTINWGDWCSAEEAQKNGWELVGGWPKIPYFDAVRYFSEGKIDTEGKTIEELCELAKSLGVEDIDASHGMATVLDKLWKKARVNTVHPFFLILPPVELEPLAKRDPANPQLTQRFQVVAGGAELGKAFSELNDPIDQFGRFSQQQAARDAGNDEAQFMDTKYVEAMEYGMPPMAGFGTSERFVSFLLGKHIRECVTFPHIRSQENAPAKSKKTLVAHAVILNTEEIPLWSKLNAAAHLAASLGAREGKKLIYIDHSTTTDGEQIPMNIQHAIMMKAASERSQLLTLKHEAEAQGLLVTCFTQEMRESSNDEKVKSAQEAKKSDDIGFLGILIFGEKKVVEKLTESLPLFS
jgi:lysyl-tRNA synthetase class 2